MAIVSLFDRARENVITRLGGVTKAQAKERADERASRAFEAGYNEGIEDEPVSGTLKRQGYKSIMGNAIRDLGGLDYDQVLNTVWKLFLSNPVAKRSMRLKRDYILGSGVTPQTDDDTLQERLNEFWHINKLAARLKKFILQLHLLGSQCYPAFVRKSDGQVRLGYIDPAQIERVICHPQNVMEKWAIVVKEYQGGDAWVKSAEKRVYRIIREQESVIGEDDRVKASQHEGKRVTADQAGLEPWESEMLKAYGLEEEYTGSCFYFSVNELSNQTMGFSDLLQEADWLDQLDAALFALADREHMADFFSYDVTLDGADDTKVKERAGEIRKSPPRKGSVNVHNDKEHWRMDRPDLKQAGSIEAARTILRFILGGQGMPEFWYAYGNETNRATAAESGTPTFRSLEGDQDNARDVILEMLYFARDQAAIAGALNGESAEAEIELVMPEMTTKDLGTIGQSLGVVAQALLTIDSLNLVTRETQAKVWAKFVSEVGVEYNPVEELEKLDEESEEETLPGMTAGQFEAIMGANGDIKSGVVSSV